MFESELRELREAGLMRTVLDRSSAQGPVITIAGKQLVNFASNDYLGLAGHREVVRAAAQALETFGFGAGASRLLAGGTVLHERLEKRIASLKGTESALVFNSGFSANTGIIPAIASGGVIFSDELNHASIIDGCRLSRQKTVVYRHRDADHLEGLLKRERSGKKVVITDSVFSMDGDVAPLKEICEICEDRQAFLYIDDAHATGVLGGGRGSLAHFSIEPRPWILQMGTFSKALGSFGAFAAGSRDVIEWLKNKARSFIFSTALPACAISASLKAIDLVERRPALLRRLWLNRQKAVEGLEALGFGTADSETPIIPLRVGNIRETLRLSSLLLENGIFAPAIRPPSVREPRIRIAVAASHAPKHLVSLVRTLETFLGKKG